VVTDGASSPPSAAEPDTVRARCWSFICAANSDYPDLVDGITLRTSDPNQLAHLVRKVEMTGFNLEALWTIGHTQCTNLPDQASTWQVWFTVSY